ncbi:MAG: hypothetical protein JWO68_2104, partial [Actinomycetia bacterium]|nr:hypothetical protein [Actinomycetes bacterium]
MSDSIPTPNPPRPWRVLLADDHPPTR